MKTIPNDVKVRSFPENNYRGIYYNGNTLRVQYDKDKPITDLEYPEFYDVKITSYCEGNCPWCYMDSTCEGYHFDNILEKVDKFFGNMTENQRPFQVAIGGGEPTTHPDFPMLLKKFRELGIAPNYTTNGMDLSDEVYFATCHYCEGVAVSCHPHLEDYWKATFRSLVTSGVKTNFHIIISDEESIDYFKALYNLYSKHAYYFVLLPYEEAGRAKSKPREFDYLFNTLMDMEDISRIAFGALFYPYLQQQQWMDMSLYEPEIMSKFLDMSDMTLYPSSFSVDKPIRKVL